MASAEKRPLDNSLRAKPRQDVRHLERHPLSDKMIQVMVLNLSDLRAATLQGYTYERQDTDYPTAKADISVYDLSGELAFQGREFRSGMASYWRPSRVNLVPEYPADDSVNK